MSTSEALYLFSKKIMHESDESLMAWEGAG
jgi:hypothetical protein